jgi:ABC-2 type transport system ATP-binding protein
MENLVVRRPNFVLSVPEWTVSPGGVFGVVGANGAGKTTLLELIPGLARADEGHLQVLGLDPIANPVEVRSSVGFMSDDMPIFSETVGRLMWFLSGYYPTWNDVLVGKLLDRFGLDERRSVTELSRGEGTRLRLITALAFEPALLVLDEPCAGLDFEARRRLLETVLDIVRDPQRAVILSSHQLGDVERVADHVLALSRGQVVAQGTPDDLAGPSGNLEHAMGRWERVG